MPQRKSSVKELRKNHTRRMHNLDLKTDLRKTTKKYLASVVSKDADQARSNLSLLYKKIDKAVKRGILQKNTAAHRKSKFSRQLPNSAS